MNDKDHVGNGHRRRRKSLINKFSTKFPHVKWQYPGHTHARDSHNMYSQQGCGSDVIGITMDSRAMSGRSFTLHVYIV